MQLSSKIACDRLFRGLVLQAYDNRCAITGWKPITAFFIRVEKPSSTFETAFESARQRRL